MLIIDGHLDLSWNALGWNRDLNLSAAEIRASEATVTGVARGQNTVGFPDMRRGRIGICFATLLARAKPRGTYPMLDFRTQEVACAMAQGQLSFYRVLEKEGKCRIITDWRSLQKSYDEWTAPGSEPPFGFIISMEGADPILRPGHVSEWFEAGLRIIGPAHYGPCVYAHGTASPGGLIGEGRELLKAMERAGMILDMTHLADEAFWEAARIFDGPVLASHNNCRVLTPGDRQFDDEQLRFLIGRDAVIGAVLDAWMLVPDWKPDKRPEATLDRVIENIDHICQLAGSARHVAIGSDLDGGFGAEQSPIDLDTIADLQKLKDGLQDRGYSESEIAGIFHQNWMSLFRRAWNSGSETE
jgi:membrane dipeptidase